MRKECDITMRSYLSLIPISAHIRRKQSKMIILCIVLAVFLVTSIFSLAEAAIRMQTENSVDKAGYWHICLNRIRESDAASIATRSDVAVSSWYDVVNLDEDFDMDKEYYIGGAQTALCGIEERFVTDIMHYFSEGAHLSNGKEIILTENAKELLGVDIGDTIILNTPAGDYNFTISGFRITGGGKYVSSNGGVVSALLVKENQIGAFMSIDTFRRICSENGETGNPQYYIQFYKHTNLNKSIEELKQQYGFTDGDIDLNTIFMAANGISDRAYIKNVYGLAVVFFLLILVAGVLMISSSMNSNVAQRLQFFGMLRCIGASRKQIIRFVRLEALNWCKTAVPTGIALGIIITWVVSVALRYMVGGEFADMPVFTVSAVGVISGALVGIVTVFFAAQEPARRAARVSPVAAVSGNAGDMKSVKHAANVRLGKVETMLGIHHAISARKNLVLMIASFAFSVILFFCFSVLVEFANCLLPQKASSPDIDIMSEDASNSIDASLADEIRGMDGVAHSFGRRICFDFPVESADSVFVPDTVDLMSYDEYQLDLLVKDHDLRKGSDISRVKGDSNCVLAIWDRDMPLGIGDKIRISGEELEITGMLKYSPFSNDGSSGGKITIIASEETFVRITGITDYAVIDVQMKSRTTDESNETVERIRKMSGAYTFRDRREESVEGTFYAMMVFVYGFLAIIALIALLNITNSISMSVSARINQYGAMRAVGMSVRQLTRMVAVEAFTYAVLGCMVGCAVGLPLSKMMYDFLITSHFYYFFWSVPVLQIAVVILFVFASTVVAIYAPSKRIRDMSVTDTLQTQ